MYEKISIVVVFDTPRRTRAEVITKIYYVFDIIWTKTSHQSPMRACNGYIFLSTCVFDCTLSSSSSLDASSTLKGTMLLS
jgi:hypothetical protein